MDSSYGLQHPLFDNNYQDVEELVERVCVDFGKLKQFAEELGFKETQFSPNSSIDEDFYQRPIQIKGSPVPKDKQTVFSYQTTRSSSQEGQSPRATESQILKTIMCPLNENLNKIVQVLATVLQNNKELESQVQKLELRRESENFSPKQHVVSTDLQFNFDSQIEADITELTQEIEDLKNELVQQTYMNKQMDREIVVLEDENAKLKRKFELLQLNFQRTISQKDQEVIELRESLKVAESDNNVMGQRVSRLELELRSSSEAEEQRDLAMKEAQNRYKQCQELSKLLDQMQMELAQVLRAGSDQEEQITTLKEIIKKQEAQIIQSQKESKTPICNEVIQGPSIFKKRPRAKQQLVTEPVHSKALSYKKGMSQQSCDLVDSDPTFQSEEDQEFSGDLQTSLAQLSQKDITALDTSQKWLCSGYRRGSMRGSVYDRDIAEILNTSENKSFIFRQRCQEANETMDRSFNLMQTIIQPTIRELDDTVEHSSRNSINNTSVISIVHYNNQSHNFCRHEINQETKLEQLIMGGKDQSTQTTEIQVDCVTPRLSIPSSTRTNASQAERLKKFISMNPSAVALRDVLISSTVFKNETNRNFVQNGAAKFPQPPRVDPSELVTFRDKVQPITNRIVTPKSLVVLDQDLSLTPIPFTKVQPIPFVPRLNFSVCKNRDHHDVRYNQL